MTPERNRISPWKSVKISPEYGGQRSLEPESTVSRLCTTLVARVRAWSERPLGRFPFLLIDALDMKVREEERGLAGVAFAVSDEHRGLVGVVRRCFQGAVWQRCQVHFTRNMLAQTHTPSLHRGNLQQNWDLTSPEMDDC